MAQVLFIEDDDIALKAMQGIIERSPHQLFRVKHGDAALNLLRKRIDFDVIIAEIKLKEGSTLGALKALKSNPFLRPLPCIIYSSTRDRQLVKNALDAGAQSFLVKPYRETSVYEEIEKAVTDDWRWISSGMADGNTTLVKRLKDEGASFRDAVESLKQRLENIHYAIRHDKSTHAVVGRAKLLSDLAEFAEETYFHELSEVLYALLHDAEKERQSRVSQHMAHLESAITVLDYRLHYLLQRFPDPEKETVIANPENNTSNTVSSESDDQPPETLWNTERIESALSELKNYPVLESAAAAFQMATTQEDTHLDDIVQMIQRDSGLAASVLKFANSSAVGSKSLIEDIQQATAVLGLARIRLLALSLKTMPEMNAAFTAFRWQDFWMHQVGCAILTEDLVRELNLSIRPEIAYLSGLTHDMGKLLLCHLDSETYFKAYRKSTENRRPLRAVERDYFGYSHEQVAAIFAKQSNLSPALQSVITYQYEPENATRDRELVATLAIANYLCMAYEIGYNGEFADPLIETLAAHPSWQILDSLLPLGFSATRLNRILETRMGRLKKELQGMVQNK